MRGGTSKGVFFHSHDLPGDKTDRDAFILGVLGSPDPYGRQLDGMGGGVSSLSKVMIVSRSERDGVDVDYMASQIAIGEPKVDFAANCGNLSSAVGVFAIDQGLVEARDGQATVRMFNLNTQKRVDCVLQVRDGRAVVDGPFKIAGVSGSGSPIRLDFLAPGGAATGSLMPTGHPVEELHLADGSTVQASIIDASTLCVFVRAADLALTGTEPPTVLRNKIEVMQRMEMIRGAAAVAAGIVSDPAEATRGSPQSPRVAAVSPAAASPMLSGGMLEAADCDIQVRMLSMGVPHLAIPLTGAMCVAVAAQTPGSLVSEAATPVDPGTAIRVGHGSGAVPVSAVVEAGADGPFAEGVSVFRTARALMEGRVFAPAGRRAIE